MSIEERINDLEDLFDRNYNADAAIQISKYFRNQFESFGLKNAHRRALSKPFTDSFKKDSVQTISDAVRALWHKPQREFQHVGMELLDRYRKYFGPEITDILVFEITHKSWWDSVDFIASHTVGWAYANGRLHKQDIQHWNGSEDIWLIRSSIIFQLKYKNQTDWDFLQQMIIPHLPHSDFFIRKAIGWALREYGKSEPQRVLAFVESNEMSGLSQREAIRRLVN